MTVADPAVLRTLAFGDVTGGPWGFVWSDRDDTVAMIGDEGERPIVIPARLDGDPAGADWSLSGEGIALRANAGHGQLCEITGTLGTGETERQLETLGVRASVPAPEPSELDSLRLILAWFTPQDGIAFASMRPRGASGQERDEVIASVCDAGGVVSIDDGRLSTTYAAGAPTRMSLELWVTDEENAFPRRTAGEVTGVRAGAELSTLTLDVRALRSHRAGNDGLGVYLLARPRR